MTRHASRAEAREAARQAAAVALNGRNAPLDRERIDRLAAYLSVRNGQTFVVGGRLVSHGSYWGVEPPPADPDDVDAAPIRTTPDTFHLYGEAGRHGIAFPVDRLIDDLTVADASFAWSGTPGAHVHSQGRGDHPFRGGGHRGA